ncbi:hypothetical protein Syun_008596 [Stephania yunnanensis]|uniref:O-methyltransferase C-terminal domain-containing protein n=1 Tax=Stephania yunnanensis TaxID=152371 RepID=A0AAP0KFH8_9MAGN
MDRAIAKAFPHIKCSVLDLPHVVASCKGTENLEFVAGDMFQAIPSADALLLKGILHDWNDEDSLKILKRCREAIGSSEKGGKLIILDIVMDSKATREIAELQTLFDMFLMVNTNGIERSEREWEKLFNEAGGVGEELGGESADAGAVEQWSSGTRRGHTAAGEVAAAEEGGRASEQGGERTCGQGSAEQNREVRGRGARWSDN